MKYKVGDRVVSAIYDDMGSKNPLIEALPEILTANEYKSLISNFPAMPVPGEYMTLSERRKRILEIEKIFIPLDYMYFVYDALCRMITSTYSTRTSKENVIRINKIFAGNSDFGDFIVQPQSASLLGNPGLSKTSTIKRTLALFLQVIEHTKYLGEPFFCKQVLYLSCECPSDASTRTMCYNIVKALDEAIGSNHLDYLMRMRTTATSSAATYIKILCITYNVGIIVIDEIQNLVSEAKRTNRVKPLIKFLTELTNDSATAIYMSGTHLAETVFTQEEYLKRRTRGLRLLPFKNDGVYKDFLIKLWPYQYTAKLAPLTDRMANTLYDYSGGVIAYITKLFEEAQSQALISGLDMINEKLIASSADFLAIKPQKILLSGKFISDFKVSLMDEKEPETPFEINFLKADEKRLYASQRGRRTEERDKQDLIAAFSSENFISKLYDLSLLEEGLC